MNPAIRPWYLCLLALNPKLEDEVNSYRDDLGNALQVEADAATRCSGLAGNFNLPTPPRHLAIHEQVFPPEPSCSETVIWRGQNFTGKLQSGLSCLNGMTIEVTCAVASLGACFGAAAAAACSAACRLPKECGGSSSNEV